MINNGSPEWQGEFEDCVLNYCPLDDLYDNISNAKAQIIDYGNSPNVTFLNELIVQIPAAQQSLGIFYANAELRYSCIDGYAFRESLQFTRTCKMYPGEIGFGRWEPASQTCKRMFFRSSKCLESISSYFF